MIGFRPIFTERNYRRASRNNDDDEDDDKEENPNPRFMLIETDGITADILSIDSHHH